MRRAACQFLLLGLLVGCSTPAKKAAPTATPVAATGTAEIPSTGPRDWEAIARDMYANEPGYEKAWPVEFHVRIVEGVCGDLANAIKNLGSPVGPDQFAARVSFALGGPGEPKEGIAGIRNSSWADQTPADLDAGQVHDAWTQWLSAYQYIERVTVKPKSNANVPAEGKFDITASLEVAGREAKGGGFRRDSGKADLSFERTPKGWRIRKFVVHGMASEWRPEKIFQDTTERWLSQVPKETLRRLTGKTASEKIYEELMAGVETGAEPVAMDAHPGVAVVDVDGDGWDDVFVWDVRGRATLLRNVDGDHFEDASARFGLDVSDVSAAAFADLDGDGVTDVVIGHWFGPSEIRKGVKTPEGLLFVPVDLDRQGLLPAQVASIALADVNRHGRLDVFFGLAAHDFHARMVELGKAPKDSDSYVDQIGPANILLVNDGEMAFHDGTKAAGLGQLRNTLSPTFADYDGDGWPDLYLGNDFARGILLHNEHGRFVDVSKESGADKIIYGMGASWGDITGTGKLDLYASAMQSSAGSRIMADEGNFRAGFNEVEKTARKLAARGNTLLHYDGGKWTDLTDGKDFGAARNGNWAYGGIFVDVDGDGFADLISLNGFFTAPGVPPDGCSRDL